MDTGFLLPDDSMMHTPASEPFMSPANHSAVPSGYLAYGPGPDISSSGHYYATTQPYMHQHQHQHQNAYYTPNNTQWLHPSSQSHSQSHDHRQSYQDSIPSSDLEVEVDPDYDVDLEMDVDVDLGLDLDLENLHPRHPQGLSLTTTGPSPPSNTNTPNLNTNTNTNPNTKDLTHYGTPSPTHPGAWRCAYPSCASPSLFRRGCDLRKHYNRHRKHLFCRHDGCAQADPAVPGAGFSSKKDRDRHEAKHNPGIRCEWWNGPRDGKGEGEGCKRVFSRVDNMKDHVRRIHKGV